MDYTNVRKKFHVKYDVRRRYYAIKYNIPATLIDINNGGAVYNIRVEFCCHSSWLLLEEKYCVDVFSFDYSVRKVPFILGTLKSVAITLFR